MPIFSFPWNLKRTEKSSPSSDIYQSQVPSERRRAVRIGTPRIAVSLKVDRGTMPVPEVVDMSTLGLGVILDQEPISKEEVFSFQEPEILKGVEIRAVKRHVQALPAKEGHPQYQIGYEFVFSSAEEQSRLLRWLTTQLQYEITEHAPEKQTPASHTTSYYSDLPTDLDIHFPTSQSEFEQSLELIPRLSIHHALIQTKFFLVLHKNSVVASLPLYADTLPFKLLADQVFPEHMKSLRSMGRNMGEVPSLYFREDVPFLKNPASVQLRKLRILFSLFPYLLTFAKNFAHLTDLVTLAPPQFEEFFHMWLFKEIGPEAKVVERKSGQLRNGYRLMWVNLRTFEKSVAIDRPEIYAMLEPFEKSPDLVAKFQNSFFPDSAVLRKWFREKNNLVSNLSPDQIFYLRSISPELLK